MKRVCLAVAILIPGALAEVDGCIADPSNAHGCHSGSSVPDATSLLQRHQLTMIESAQMPIFDSNAAVMMKSRVDGRCLEKTGAQSSIRMEPCHGGRTQSWHFEDNMFVVHAETRCNARGCTDIFKCLQHYISAMNVIAQGHCDYYKEKGNAYWRLEGDLVKTSGKNQGRTVDEKCLQNTCVDLETYEKNGCSQSPEYKDCTGDLNQQWEFVPINSSHVDCTMSDWGEWTACSQTCGDSKRSRSRTVTKEASFGGKCGATEDVELCSVPACPAPLSSLADNKCLDYDFSNDNVFMYTCHGGSNQQWLLDGNKRLTTQKDSKCLDYNFNSGNVYMRDCHGGSNQKWVYDGTYIKSEKDLSKCLDYAHGHSTNVGMADCYQDTNRQKWRFVR